jgi:hypothetical protein
MNLRAQRRAMWTCVFFRTPSPHIYRCVQGCYDQESNMGFLEPTLGTNGEVPHWRFKSVELALVWPNHLVRLNQVKLQPTSAFAEWLVSGPWGLWCMVWCCLESFSCSGGSFDPCEAEPCVLISRPFAPWIMIALFMCFQQKYTCIHV